MQNRRAISGATHARIGNAHHIGDALFEHLGWQGHVADFRHAGVTARATVLQHHDAVFIDVQVRIINLGVELFNRFKHHGGPTVLQQMLGRGRRFDHGAVGGQIATDHRNASCRHERIVDSFDHVAVVARGVGHVFTDGFSVYCERISVQHRQNFAHHCGQAAGVAKIFHQVLARRLQVQDVVDFRTQLVEVFELQVDADAPCNRQQVNDCVGGATDCRIGADGILKRLSRHDLRHLDVLLDHFYDAAAC